MKLSPITSPSQSRRNGFTLAEVIIAICISAISLGGVICAYLMSADQAEWSGYSLAAHSLALQQSEQARACKWDPLAQPPVDQLVTSNFPPRVEIMDLPASGTNLVYATNLTSISVATATPALKMIRVDCVWAYRNRALFTNTVVTYRAPDQ